MDLASRRGVASVDLAAITANTRSIGAAASGAAVMAVVKDDAYGHGAVESARAAIAGGATWLGVATIDEGLELRSAGIELPTLVLLVGANEDLDAAIAADLDLAVGNERALAQVAASAARAGFAARVHLELDTGMGRGGALADTWDALARRACSFEADGTLRVTGIWSHFACADEPEHPSVALQLESFRAGLALMESAGLDPDVRHMANSAAIFARPESHFDLVRPGLSLFGVAPSDQLGDEASLGLRGAMTLSAPVAAVKSVAPGQGVSYGLTYSTSSQSRLAVVPIGYSDGIPRSGSGRAPVQLKGRRYQVAGRVCMDQFVLDVGDVDVSEGDTVVAFGPGDNGEPSVREFARACGTIANEVLTGIGSRVHRHFVPAN